MSNVLPRCEIRPLPDHQVAFLIDGRERLRWHFGGQYPRPFFYPLLGPSHQPLTRMGHPGAPNHDHHRSIWFAHRMVQGIDFWSDQTKARIRQQQWLAYQDGDREAILAVRLGWYDGHDPRPLLRQDLVAALRPLDNGELWFEMQARFLPTADVLEFGRTNFGFLAVRVAKPISEYFGGGRLANSHGATGEPAIFGQKAEWVDYSGPVQPDRVEGITYFDHPANPGFPCHWHVRSDGWMGASVCMNRPVQTRSDQPLTLRYLIHAHRGPLDADRAAATAAQFAATTPFVIEKGRKRHCHYSVRRA